MAVKWLIISAICKMKTYRPKSNKKYKYSALNMQCEITLKESKKFSYARPYPVAAVDIKYPGRINNKFLLTAL